MNDSASNPSPLITIALLSGDARIGGDFVRQISAPGELGVLRAGDSRAKLHLVAGDQLTAAAVADVVAAIDGVALLVHHIDVDSMDLIRKAYGALPGDHRIPLAILLIRESGRLEFKMACPTCNQKLWVRDEDSGRVGRCPHCKKTFQLPTQTSVLKAALNLPDIVPVVTSVLGHAASCSGPVAALAERALHRQRAQKASTVPVQLPHDTQGGATPSSPAAP